MTNRELHKQLVDRLIELSHQRSQNLSSNELLVIYGRMKEVGEQLQELGRTIIREEQVEQMKFDLNCKVGTFSEAVAAIIRHQNFIATLKAEKARRERERDKQFRAAIELCQQAVSSNVQQIRNNLEFIEKFNITDEELSGSLNKDIATAFDKTFTTIQQRIILFDALQSKRISMAGKLILRNVLRQFENCELLTKITESEKIAEAKVNKHIHSRGNGRLDYKEYKRIDTIHAHLKFVRLILEGSREIPFFHGGCHYCTVPRDYGVGKCPSCQMFLANWDLPDLNPTHKDRCNK
jgi:hypothetical protein